MPIIGINGKFGAGKDVIAAHLGGRRIAFADALKEEVFNRLRRTLRAAYTVSFPSVAASVENEGGEGLLDLYTWTCLTQTKPPIFRELLQEYGTEVRRADDQDYWVKRWKESVSVRSDWMIVAPDMRFKNEARAVKEMGGYCILVTRPGHNGNGHVSETELDDWREWDAVFNNDGTIKDLTDKVDQWQARIREKRD